MGIRDTNYCYVLFVTPSGKGYGCFSINVNGENSYEVAASFCHPADRNKFSKKIARAKADAKIQKKRGITYEFDRELKVNDCKAIVMHALKNDYNPIDQPSWVRKALEIEAFCMTLSSDSASHIDLIDELGIGTLIATSFVRGRMLEKHRSLRRKENDVR